MRRARGDLPFPHPATAGRSSSTSSSPSSTASRSSASRRLSPLIPPPPPAASRAHPAASALRLRRKRALAPAHFIKKTSSIICDFHFPEVFGLDILFPHTFRFLHQKRAGISWFCTKKFWERRQNHTIWPRHQYLTGRVARSGGWGGARQEVMASRREGGLELVVPRAGPEVRQHPRVTRRAGGGAEATRAPCDAGPGVVRVGGCRS